jgi:hypothetical protein
MFSEPSQFSTSEDFREVLLSHRSIDEAVQPPPTRELRMLLAPFVVLTDGVECSDVNPLPCGDVV